MKPCDITSFREVVIKKIDDLCKNSNHRYEDHSILSRMRYCKHNERYNLVDQISRIIHDLKEYRF